MNITKIIGIVVPIVIIIIAVPIALNSFSNLQKLGADKESAKEIYVPQFLQQLDTCDNAKGPMIDLCKEQINFLQGECSFYDNPPVCNDPRINKIKSATYTAPPLNVQSPTSYADYTNSQFGFSITYPTGWFTHEGVEYQGEKYIVNIGNKIEYPDAVFIIKERHNSGSFDDAFVNTIMSNPTVTGYPVNLQSKDTVMVGNKNAYVIQYSQKIGDSDCTTKDYVINDGSFVPVIEYGSCDANAFLQFMPIFDKMASTFR